ncbi:MFS transporter [Nocardioides caldifontis]|uniref:MFS transporter n=1 Tax=Nocardioides caldifontis TaxID=2588938 RepID=UPI0011DF841D|nr:MFS transporter [Nocardioides caldifontis]
MTGQEAPERPGPAAGRGTAGPAQRLLVACLLGGSAGWALTAPGAAAAPTAEAYGADLLWVGLLTSVLAAPYAALQLPAGVLVDRLGVRTATSAGLSLVVLAHVAALVAPVPWLALAARTLSGAGYAVCFVSGAELARSSGRGARGMGVFGGVAIAASGFAVLTVPFAEHLVGWRSPWATTLVVTALALALALRLPDELGQSTRAAPVHTGGSPPPAILRDGQLFRLAAVHGVTLGLGLILSSWATTLLEDIWSFGPAAAAVVGSCVLGLSVLSRPLGGQLAAVRPDRSRTLWVFALVACAAATLALAWRSTPVVAVLAVAVLGMCSGLPFASVVQAGQARQPHRPAAAVGAMNTLAFGLVVAATPAVGWAVDHGHASTTLVVVGAVWLLPLLSLPRRPGQPAPVPA